MKIVLLIDEEEVKSVIATAEKALKESWIKLTNLQSTTTSKQDRFHAFVSFQADLFSALIEVESFYNEICKCQRKLPSTKFAKEREKLKLYKELLNEIIDIGKTMGDAFAWIFYQNNRALLKKHYSHEFIPRIPTRLQGNERLVLSWDIHLRDCVATAQRVLNDVLAKEIQDADIDNAEKIELLGHHLFGKKWQGRELPQPATPAPQEPSENLTPQP